ncbi:hypothetical protein ACXR0M_25120 [Pseudomonas sp. Eth.TT006]
MKWNPAEEGKNNEGMDEKALSGHESVGIMPQGVTACASPGAAISLFFLQAVGHAAQRVGQLTA